jgi:hypothetical protein
VPGLPDKRRVDAFRKGCGRGVGLLFTDYMDSKAAAMEKLRYKVRRLDEAKKKEYEMDRHARTMVVSRGRSLYR